MSDEGQTPGQLPLFDETTPGAAVSASETPEGVLMPRTPGWALLGPSDGLWHHPMTRHYDGSVTAACGRTGRYLADVAHEIMACPTCAESTPPI